MGLIDRIDFKSSLGFDRIKEYVQGKDGPEKTCKMRLQNDFYGFCRRHTYIRLGDRAGGGSSSDSALHLLAHLASGTETPVQFCWRKTLA